MFSAEQAVSRKMSTCTERTGSIGVDESPALRVGLNDLMGVCGKYGGCIYLLVHVKVAGSDGGSRVAAEVRTTSVGGINSNMS